MGIQKKKLKSGTCCQNRLWLRQMFVCVCTTGVGSYCGSISRSPFARTSCSALGKHILLKCQWKGESVSIYRLNSNLIRTNGTLSEEEGNIYPAPKQSLHLFLDVELLVVLIFSVALNCTSPTREDPFSNDAVVRGYG